MFLEIPADPQQLLNSTVQLPLGTTQLWRPTFRIQELGDPRIIGARFEDFTLIDAQLVERALAQAAVQPDNARGRGGKKIRDAVTWDLPAARLLTIRALFMCCHLLRKSSAHILDRWINVMQHQDYSAPHCHYEAEMAAVYFLDAGDVSPGDSTDGAFELIDPRVPFCCPHGPERPIRGLMPAMGQGTMILFPATFLHHVRPYSGHRPRLTIAWNICSGPPPTDRVIDPTKEVPFKEGAVKGAMG
jgi:hypothetical protein